MNKYSYKMLQNYRELLSIVKSEAKRLTLTELVLLGKLEKGLNTDYLLEYREGEYEDFIWTLGPFLNDLITNRNLFKAQQFIKSRNLTVLQKDLEKHPNPYISKELRSKGLSKESVELLLSKVETKSKLYIQTQSVLDKQEAKALTEELKSAVLNLVQPDSTDNNWDKWKRLGAVEADMDYKAGFQFSLQPKLYELVQECYEKEMGNE